MAKTTLPKLPQLLDRKIYKTSQTRGADDDEIFQNRVGRNSTVLIRYEFWDGELKKLALSGYFENGYIVLIKPSIYFSFKDPVKELKTKNLVLGKNCLVFYQTKNEWISYNPDSLGWKFATSRQSPLNGYYVARVPATTAAVDGGKINRGFTETKSKGAGIRLYEYANTETIQNTRLQLEAIFWLCYDSEEIVTKYGMNIDDAKKRKKAILEKCDQLGLLDYEKLKEVRILNSDLITVCPLCLKKISAHGFFSRLAQAEGRDVPDLTITETSLFHIHELRYNEFNHKPYNLGWGDHFCNVVAKDSGIQETLNWMKDVLKSNGQI